MVNPRKGISRSIVEKYIVWIVLVNVTSMVLKNESAGSHDRIYCLTELRPVGLFFFPKEKGRGKKVG